MCFYREKKDHSQYIRKTHQTGGGPPPPPPKPTDELTLIVQGILSADLPRPSDILDSECVQTYEDQELQPTVSSIECGELESLVYLYAYPWLYRIDEKVSELMVKISYMHHLMFRHSYFF